MTSEAVCPNPEARTPLYRQRGALSRNRPPVPAPHPLQDVPYYPELMGRCLEEIEDALRGVRLRLELMDAASEFVSGRTFAVTLPREFLEKLAALDLTIQDAAADLSRAERHVQTAFGGLRLDAATEGKAA